jgi:mRNA interferase RelE/StbE
VGKVYELFLEPRAQKELDRVPATDFSKIDRAILSLSKNPRPFGVKKLDEQIHRVRVQDWRILYAIFDREARVVVLRVKRRNEKTYK